MDRTDPTLPAKPKNAPAKLDTLNVWTLYSLTLNGDDVHGQGFGVTNVKKSRGIDTIAYKDRLQHVRKHYSDLFGDCCLHGVYYYFVEEMSIPENNVISRFHLHGYIYFTTREAILYYLLELLPAIARYHTYSFKLVDDFTIWWEYCNKQRLLGEITNIFGTARDHLQYIFNNPRIPIPEETAPTEESEIGISIRKHRVKKSKRIIIRTDI